MEGEPVTGIEILMIAIIVCLVAERVLARPHERAHCSQIGKLQSQLYEVDPVRFAEYSPEEMGDT